MSKATGQKKTRRRGQTVRASPDRAVPAGGAWLDALLHPQTPDEPVWRYFWPLLALAFAARAAVALQGDSMLHYDEIMQHLEPAHKLAFGNGVTHWEFFYGVRSWLLPGFIAGILKLFDAVGLGQPFWYVAGVKLVLCAISLLIPAGMYVFSRQHFGETTARVTLLAGVFWYELVGFAHKPMTEFVATGLLMTLLALSVRPPACGETGWRNEWGAAWLVAFLAVLATAIRIQYAPLALVLLGVCFLRSGARVQVVLAAVLSFLAVGAFDGVTWGGKLFHPYVNYFLFYLHYQFPSSDTMPAIQYLPWLAVTSGGMGMLCLLALRRLRRYGFLLILITLVLLVHSAQPHKEYRYVFVVIPLWLLVVADVVTQLTGRGTKPAWTYGAFGTLFAAVSLAGILNVLPFQNEVYRSDNRPFGFVRNQGTIVSAYRYLAHAPGVKAVWQVDRLYSGTPGYYYLHRKIPFYDVQTGQGNTLHKDLKTLHGSVSHLVTEDPNLAVPGYAVEKEFGDVRILRREDNEAPIRRWQNFAPVIDVYGKKLMRRLYPDAPQHANFNIRFVESE